MDEIRRLKSLLVKHEKRIRVLEARTASMEPAMSPSSANTTLISEPSTPTSTPSAGGENNHHVDTNANKTGTTEELAPDEVWMNEKNNVPLKNNNSKN